MPKRKPGSLSINVEPVRTEEDLENALSEPSSGVIDAMRRLEGDLIMLGAGGKIGPSLIRMAVRADQAAGVKRRIIAVSTFSEPGLQTSLKRLGVETIQANLLDENVIQQLPSAPNVMYLLGRKFGSTGAEWNTWAVNVYAAGMIARHYRNAQIVAFSSGNVYPFCPVGKGATESTTPAPVGEYAMSCLGRERMFDAVAHTHGTRIVHFRLNYAAELRYGVVHDIGRKVWAGEPVDLTMGFANVVWQGYVNAVALQSLTLASAPPAILNVTGPETVSIRWLAERFGALFGKTPQFTGEEAPTALLSNAAACFKQFGYPEVTLDALIERTAWWIAAGKLGLGKPTHFEARDGKF